ncbi:MAG: hypothetical protein M1831_006505 [Alyxoria varia]|nr:MAG: hypothetical protein M1831_006505 [Alyxoria varia]
MSTKNTLRLPVFNHLVSPNLYTSCADGSLPCFHPESGIHIPIRIIENYQSLQIDIYLDWNPGADLLSNLEALVSSLAARSSRGTKRLRCLKLDFDFTAQDMYQSADAANEFCEIANTLVAPFRKLRCLKDVQVAFFAGTMSQGSMLATNSEPREWAVPLQARISKHSQEVVKEIKGHGP